MRDDAEEFAAEDTLVAFERELGITEEKIATSSSAFFPFNGGLFESGPEGVYFVKGDTKKHICDELRIEAMVRDAKSLNWGLLLRWIDSDGQPHRWSMPMKLLHGERAEVLRELASGGLRISPGASNSLLEYLQACPVEERVTCVARTGWYGSVYCTPTETIGSGNKVCFQGAGSGASDFSQRGTAEDWRSSVAMMAAGNSRLVFAVSSAFAGPLLHLAEGESGGFHLVGPSSSGKTTALGLSASVWGSPSHFMRTWRATSNGLEGIAAQRNDNLLILDELGQCDPKQVGEAAYLLANGKGKVRATLSGGAREAAQWSLLFLSSGETKLETLMDAERKKANAGQVLRMASIPIDAGKGMGGFEELHGAESPGSFAQHLARAGESTYGLVGVEWLRHLASDLENVGEIVAKGAQDFVKEVLPLGASGQAGRVAHRFGLVAAAGELATAYRLTGWSEGEADAAAATCFRAWLEDFGSGLHEDHAACEQVRLFLEQHGSSRFQSMEAGASSIPNRAGFWRKGANGWREYLVLPMTFRAEVLKGLDVKLASKALEAEGLLTRGSDRVQIKVRLPELGSTWVYCLKHPEEVAA